MVFNLKNPEKLKEVQFEDLEDGAWYLVGTAKKYAQPMLCTVFSDDYGLHTVLYPITGNEIYFHEGDTPGDTKFWEIEITNITAEPY